MKEPKLTAVCVTYGRVPQLENALACFLAQDYQGPKEMVIYNTFPGQGLRGTFPNVKIINAPSRPPSLGKARNEAITEASGEIIVTWDDDDIFLPGHLSTIAKVFGENAWIWLNRQFSAMGNDIKEITAGSCPLFSFRKSAWSKVGGYPHMGTGEDRAFISRVTQALPGQRVMISPAEISFIYRWGNGVYHMSGEGDDKPGRLSSHERARLDLEKRVRQKLVKLGDIELRPHSDIDWVKKARAYQFAMPPAPARKSVCIVELGRYGDIVNILPICQHVAENYQKPYLVVSRQFADILDGVSYVTPYPVDLTHDRLKDGLRIARENFGFVMQGQVWGTDCKVERQCDAFNRESWRLLGFQHRFDDATLVPYFDQRNKEREAVAAAKVFGARPFPLLVNLTSSHSSPWPEGKRVLEWLTQKWGEKFSIVDASRLKLERIYDIVGLMERAAGLISIDTALIHLAACCNVPTVAIRNPTPWLGSAVRKGVNIYGISDYKRTFQDPGAVLDGPLTLMLDRTSPPGGPKEFRPLRQPPVRRIIHVVERHKSKSPADESRVARAQETWEALYRSGVVPCHVWQTARNARQTIRDPRQLPYLKDVLEVGLKMAGPEDIIMWTNDDNHLHRLLPELLQFYVSIYEAVSSHRCEFEKRVPSQDTHPEDIAAGAHRPHIGRDLFAFTKPWLLAHWTQLPDFILGASEFDLCIAAMIRVEKQIASNRQNLADCIWPCEIPKGFVSHEWHAPYWNRPENADAAPSQRHNRLLFYLWAQKHLPSLKFTPILTI